MNNALQVFDYNVSAVRTVEKDREVWFVAKDVCDVLELSNPTEALRGLDEDEKSSLRISEGTSTKGGNPNMNIINEAGVYSLVFRSSKAEAKAFSRWVRHIVLPQIRETGSFKSTMRFAICWITRMKSCTGQAERMRPAGKHRVYSGRYRNIGG